MTKNFVVQHSVLRKQKKNIGATEPTNHQYHGLLLSVKRENILPYISIQLLA